MQSSSITLENPTAQMWLVEAGKAVRRLDEGLPNLQRIRTNASISSTSSAPGQLEAVDAIGGTIEAARIVFFREPEIFTISGNSS